MKHLLLIRHAKSSWKDIALDDRDRPLNKRGKRDAPAMGQLLKKSRLFPDLILSSPATRARKTARKIARELDYASEHILIREEIYLHGVSALLSIITGLDDTAQRVFLVGHNPDLTELANRLSGEQIDNIPTCGIVALEFPVSSWRHCPQTQGRLTLFARPAKDVDAPAS